MFQDKLFSKPHNIHYLNRYITFITLCKHKNRVKGDNHHILPKAKDMFPEYSDFNLHEWNKVKLSKREHFIAHMILWKAYPESNSQLYAFFSMKNKNHVKINSKIFQKLKEDIAKAKLNKGFIIAKDKNENIYRIHKEDPRWISGELVGMRKNIPAHENTKKATSERWKGISKHKEHNRKNSESMKKLKWYHNFSENKTKRFKENEVPEGYIRICGPHRILTEEQLFALKESKLIEKRIKRESNLEIIRKNISDSQKRLWEDNPMRGISAEQIEFTKRILLIYKEKPKVNMINNCNKQLNYKRAFAKEYSKIENVSLYTILSIINGTKNKLLSNIKDEHLQNIISEILNS